MPRGWECPNCTTTMAAGLVPGTPFHACKGLAGLSAPMIPVGLKVGIKRLDREDYVSGDDVQVDGLGRVFGGLHVERDDGQDCVIYAPCARATTRFEG